MPRLDKKTTENREKLMLGYFKADPKLSIPKANLKLKEETGSMMRAQRAYQLRDIAKTKAKDAVHTAAEASKPSEAGRKNVKRPTKAARIVRGEGGSKLVVVEGSSENIAFFKKAVSDLAGSGLAPNLKIDVAQNGYAVVSG